MSEKKLVFMGIIISPTHSRTLNIWTGYLVVEYGKITRKGLKEEFERLQKAGEFSDFKIILLDHDQFLIPGFIDCHTHAPQFPNIGLGLDQPLLQWLNKYTFPLESQYGNVDFAAKVYDQVVQRMIQNGTTTACYFGSLHLEGTMELVKSVIKHRQRAIVGKVSMNIENDHGYYNDTKTELAEVETFVKNVLAYENKLVQPAVTPRFAVSCDKELMTGLAKIAQKYDCIVQSHISENKEEIKHVLETHSDCKHYSEIYDKCQILNNKCIMAHAIYLSDEEVELFAARGVAIAHCPASNTRLHSGLCPARKYIDKNIKVGLGTDVSGGDSATIMEAIRRAMDVSIHLEMFERESFSFKWMEAFYLATLGGAKALNLDHKIGNFEVGKEFDALLVDVYVNGGQIDYYECFLDRTEAEYAISLMQRFTFLGDDRNILQVYVKGEKVKDITPKTINMYPTIS